MPKRKQREPARSLSRSYSLHGVLYVWDNAKSKDTTKYFLSFHDHSWHILIGELGIYARIDARDAVKAFCRLGTPARIIVTIPNDRELSNEQLSKFRRFLPEVVRPKREEPQAFHHS